jgi:hypothetical protein
MSEKQEIVVREPSAMIELAVSKGADLDKLEKLLTLQERWESGEARKAYHKAMADFKANPPKIDKDKTVSFKTNAGQTTYNHATLANVTEKISSELSKYGLSASWETQQNGQIVVTCKITHEKGHSEQTSLSAPADVSGSKNPIQAIGSTVTYLERYTLLALTGLATYDQDDDAVAAVEYIDNGQVSIIRDMLIELGMETKEAAFLKFMGVDSLERMPKAKFNQAIAALEAKKAKVQK